MYIIVNNNLRYFSSYSLRLVDRERAAQFDNLGRAMRAADIMCHSMNEELAVLDTLDDDHVVYVAEPEVTA